MSSKYDSKTSIFSPEGRLLQVENAIKNIGNAGLCIGIVTNEGIILTCEKESISKLYERGRHSEKIYTIDRNIAVGVGGLAADANLLIDYSRRYSQSYFIKYKNLTPVEKLVKYVSDVMQKQFVVRIQFVIIFCCFIINSIFLLLFYIIIVKLELQT
jgi:20S proteasome subunit alpha 3